jgi:hypothetical protein
MVGVPGMVCRGIATHPISKAGVTRKTARTGAVTLSRRFGSALDLNIPPRSSPVAVQGTAGFPLR